MLTDDPTNDAEQDADELLTQEREQMSTLREQAREAERLRRLVEQERARLAQAEQSLEKLQGQVRELLAQRQAFVDGGMLERRKLTHAWEAERRDAGFAR